jgi:hypothetical protein
MDASFDTGKKTLLFPGRNHLAILSLAWIVVQAFLFSKNGILTGFESGKYIEQANYFIDHGTVGSPNFWLYSVQIFLIAASVKLLGGFALTVIVQLLVNALATFYFYQLCKKLGDQRTAFVCTLLLILNIPFQQFNTFLFTESLFYSFIILFSCFLLQITKLSFSTFLTIILFLLLICFTRPTGLLLTPCVFIYLFSKFFNTWPSILKISSTIIISLLFVFILNLALGTGGELNFILPFAEEHIICGVPTVNPQGQTNGNSLGSIFNYIIDHPGQFLHLAWLRSLAFWGLFRSYFSPGHNIFLAVYFFPVYLLAIFSLNVWWKKNRPLLLYAISFILITWGTVILSCDDWHNRFFLTLMPFIYILSLPAIQKILAGAAKQKSR